MLNLREITDLARAQAREVLRRTPSFQQLSRDEQAVMYRRLVEERARELARQQGDPLARELAAPKPPKASDLINDARHTNSRIDQAGELAGDFVESVDFPKFVRDLLKGVFDANLEVTLKQMESYQTLLKTATQSVSKFVNAIDDTASFGYLAENNSDEFGLSFSDSEKDESGQPKQVLVDKAGNPVDLGDNAVKAKIMEAKIAMAKEQRALLRETILMGITRLVVQKGVVKASVVFDIKAGEKIQKQDKAAMKKSKSSGSSISGSGGLLGALFGGPSGGHTSSNRETQISISSAKSVAQTDLAAKIMGSVEIIFASDYFKLDNFASLYGPVSDGGAPLQAGGSGGGNAGTAAAPASAAPTAPSLSGR